MSVRRMRKKARESEPDALVDAPCPSAESRSTSFVVLVRGKIHVAHAARKPRRYGQSQGDREGSPDRKNLDNDHAGMSTRMSCDGLARRLAPARLLSAVADNFKTGRDAELMPKSS